MKHILLAAWFVMGGLLGQVFGAERLSTVAPPVVVTEDVSHFTLANGWVRAQIDKRSGTLTSLKYQGLELLAVREHGADGGYWSSVGRGRIGSQHAAILRINPASNGGARAEISCRFQNNSQSPDSGVDAEYRYALGRGEPALYVYAVLQHQPGYPGFGVGEARYCLKLNPDVFDYLSVDADRQRLMPSGYDWDHGAPLNLKEARRMTTGVHKGEVEHKYDYSAVLADTPAYGWLSTKRHVGLWLVNPSIEYLGGGPTKVELTGHLDVNAGGNPTLLNMWVGSHYGGTTLAVTPNESWTKVVGPFLLYCNSASSPAAMWRDALAQAATQAAAWPFDWLAETNYPTAAQRGTVRGRVILQDVFAPDARMSNLWVGLTAPDYSQSSQFRNNFRRNGATNLFRGTRPANPLFNMTNSVARNGFPWLVDWQRDAKFYQFWVRADAAGRFTIRNVRPGNYTMHAFADGVLGEFVMTNITVAAAESKSLGELRWQPARFGRTLWEIGVPDRTAREFRHGDNYWRWGLYNDYQTEFPNDVNYIIGRSDWRKDWNYAQPPRIVGKTHPVVSEDEDQNAVSESAAARFASSGIRGTTWRIQFDAAEKSHGQATLRLAFCGARDGCNVEVFVNGRSIGDTGRLPSTGVMHRDGIRGYWFERDLSFAADLLKRGPNVIKLTSPAKNWTQGVMYDYLRLELNDSPR